MTSSTKKYYKKIQIRIIYNIYFFFYQLGHPSPRIYNIRENLIIKKITFEKTCSNEVVLPFLGDLLYIVKRINAFTIKNEKYY